MKVLVAKKAGFCFGVQRAVDIATEKTESTDKLYSYGQLIHNDQVSKELAEKGLVETHDITSLKDESLIIRSHGVGKDIYVLSDQNNLEVIDCTCPFVKKVQKIVDEHHKKGYRIIIVGDDKHPEVQGINGWCDHSAIIIQSADVVPNLSEEKFCVVAQTTLKLQVWETIVDQLKAQTDEIVCFNTICSATSERQLAAKELAKQVDCMVVVGGYHSSNTKKLYEICKSICENTVHIEKKSDLVVTKLKNCGIIGITAGASTPDWIINEVHDYLIGI